jgi:hypothetical protein
MIKISKIILIVAVLFGATQGALADRGIGKKSKSKITLNINTRTTLRNSVSLNLKSGLRYSGSLFASQQSAGSSMNNNTLVTYQKGNTVYIIPYKQKLVTPEVKPGYTGMKLIIRPH